MKKPPPLGPAALGAPKLEALIEYLEAQSRELADEWTYDGTTFEQDQHTRLAAIDLFSAAIHLRSLRSHFCMRVDTGYGPVTISHSKPKRGKK